MRSTCKAPPPRRPRRLASAASIEPQAFKHSQTMELIMPKLSTAATCGLVFAAILAAGLCRSADARGRMR